MLREGRWSHQPSGLSCSGQAVVEAVWRAGIRVPELWAGGQSLSMGITASPLRTHFLSRLRRGAAASTRNCSCELPQGARPPADRGSTWGWGGAQGPGWPAPMPCPHGLPRPWPPSPRVGCFPLGWTGVWSGFSDAVLTSCLHVSFSLQASGCTWPGAACPVSR